MAIEKHLESRQLRRMRSENRYLANVERREMVAVSLVGELCREGATRFYINQLNQAGRPNGRTVEFDSVGKAVNYLIRNKYV